MPANVCNAVLDIARTELGAIEKQFDSLSSEERCAVFLELTRTIDLITVIRPAGWPYHRFELVQWGWNWNASRLLQALSARGVPTFRNEENPHRYMRLLRVAGLCSLLRRVAELARIGAVQITQDGNQFEIAASNQELMATSFADALEFARFARSADDGKSDGDRIEWLKIRSQMDRLVFPWDSGRGVMTGYGATPEVDYHYFKRAANLIEQWRDETGLHPDVMLGNVRAGHAFTAATYMISLHLKHVGFVHVAHEKHPDISVYKSLTIWGEWDKLIEETAEFAGISAKEVRDVFAAISLRASEAAQLSNRTEIIRPLLIDLENGYYLRPCSSVAQNALQTIRFLEEIRRPNAHEQIALEREPWLRSYLYALFVGTRYRCVDGNVKLRQHGSTITDVDAAVFDTISGDLALFQIKWQDVFTNDIRKLRSRAKNLSEGMNQWAGVVERWVKERDSMEIARTFRIPEVKHGHRGTHLFGISYGAARCEAFGYEVNSNVAMSNWPQFLRNRLEVGAQRDVFMKLHERLLHERTTPVAGTPQPVTEELGGFVFHFKDLWWQFG